MGTFIGRPIWLLLCLDLAGVLFAIAAFEQVMDPDVLLHMVWVVLAIDAFAFGLRVTSVRIVIGTAAVLTYSAVAEGGATPVASSLEDLGLAEWPLMVVIAVIVAVMADRVSSTSRRYAALYRQANNRLLTAQEDERRRLARDVHDGVGQTIVALSLTLDAAESMLWAPAEPPSRLSRDAITRAQELAAIALVEARDVAHRLRPARIKEAGLIASIHELAAAAGRPVEVRADPALVRPGLLGLDTELEIFRIVQEAVGNSVRHANAAHHWVGAEIRGHDLHLVVSDDGVGFDRSVVSALGLGLAGMEDRALAAGLDLAIRGRPGRGTSVIVSAPLPAATVALLRDERRQRVAAVDPA